MQKEIFKNNVGWHYDTEPTKNIHRADLETIRRFRQSNEVKIQHKQSRHWANMDKYIEFARKCLRCQKMFKVLWRTNYICKECTRKNLSKDRSLE
tara:strand:- start:156 stop:440 length:285 start_codon:yes stop_codon:yes gene_type:complete